MQKEHLKKLGQNFLEKFYVMKWSYQQKYVSKKINFTFLMSRNKSIIITISRSKKIKNGESFLWTNKTINSQLKLLIFKKTNEQIF